MRGDDDSSKYIKPQSIKEIMDSSLSVADMTNQQKLDKILALMVGADKELVDHVYNRTLEKSYEKVHDFGLSISNEPKDVFKDEKGRLFYFAGVKNTKTMLSTCVTKSVQKKLKLYMDSQLADEDLARDLTAEFKNVKVALETADDEMKRDEPKPTAEELTAIEAEERELKGKPYCYVYILMYINI